MRLLWLTWVFYATTATAVPHIRKKDAVTSPSNTNPPSQTPTLSQSSASLDPIPTDKNLLCQPDHMNTNSWIKYDMGDQVEFLAELIPDDYTKSFREFIEEKSFGYTNFDCNFSPDGRSCANPNNEAACQHDPTEGPLTNAEYNFMLYSIYNMWKLFNAIMNGIEDAMDDLDSVGLGLSGVFSPLDYKPQHQEDNDTWIITILAGVFGMAGGMLTGALGRFTEGNGFQAAINADAAAGMSSGLTTIINGMENALITTESDAVAQGLQIFNNEVNVSYIGLNQTKYAIAGMFNTIVNGLVHNAMDSETYVVNSNASLSSVLKSGVFASPASDFTTFQIGSTMVNSLRVSEINTLWMLQSVFIAKLSGVWYGGTPICDIKLYTSAVACIDGTAYFFMIAGDETPGGDHQWPAVRGADQLGTYGLNLTYIATTSEWSQNKYGFAANFTSDLRSTITNTLALQGQVAPDNDWFTLPECDLDYLNKTYNTEKYSGGGVPLWPYQNTLDNLAGGCADECGLQNLVRTMCPLTSLNKNDGSEDLPWPLTSGFIPKDQTMAKYQ